MMKFTATVTVVVEEGGHVTLPRVEPPAYPIGPQPLCPGAWLLHDAHRPFMSTIALFLRLGHW